MSHVCRPITILSLLVLAIALPAAAQNPPSGSYQKTCKSISMSGTTLTATCNMMNGQPAAPSQLAFATSCVGDVANVNGILACTGATGSFAATCRNISVSGTTLSAQCQTKSGQWVSASLPNFQGFGPGISNCNGQLQNGPCS